MAIDPERYYETNELAEALGVNRETVRRWIRSGRLPAQRTFVGRRYKVKGADVLALLSDLEREQIEG